VTAQGPTRSPRWLLGLVDVLSSFGLSCVLLIFLALLTWLGTLEQVEKGLYDVQSRYFESLYVIHRAGPVPFPLPGGMLVMGLLTVNLIVGGIVRIRKGAATVGVLVTHVGILMLLVAGYVKTYHAEDGHTTLYEGQSSNVFRSYHRWELAIFQQLDDRRLREIVAPQEAFIRHEGAEPAKLVSGELPFDVELRWFTPNANVLPKGPMVRPTSPVVEGFVISPLPVEKDNERNLAAVIATVVDKAGGPAQEAILDGFARQPWTVRVAGQTWGLELRREQYQMPFTVELDDFRKEDHPRLNMPKSFSSDVTVIADGTERPVRISMNEPLRRDGLVLYQASWGPSNARPGDPLFSTLAVVRNPSDQYPLYACIVIAAGLVLHFSRKLLRHIRSQGPGDA
jgi:hypothetical protein